MTNVIIIIIENIIVIGAFLIGRYLLPKFKIPDNNTTRFLSEWAYKFVVDAKNTIASDGLGKKNYVTRKMAALTRRYGIKISYDQISALIEDAYSAMKAGEKIAEKN